MSELNFNLGIKLGRLLRPEVSQAEVADLVHAFSEAFASDRIDGLPKNIESTIAVEIKAEDVIEKKVNQELEDFKKVEVQLDGIPPLESKPTRAKDQYKRFVDTIELTRQSIKYQIKDIESEDDFDTLLLEVEYPSAMKADILREITKLSPRHIPNPKEEVKENKIDLVTNPGVNKFDPEEFKVPEDLKDFIVEDKDHKYKEEFFDPSRDSFAGTLTGGKSNVITEKDALRRGMKLVPIEEGQVPLGEKKAKREKKEKKPKVKLTREENQKLFAEIMGWFNELPKDEILQKRLINSAFPEVEDVRINMIKWALSGAGYLSNTGIGYFKMLKDIPEGTTYTGLLTKMAEDNLNKEQGVKTEFNVEENASNDSEGSNTGQQL